MVQTNILTNSQVKGWSLGGKIIVYEVIQRQKDMKGGCFLSFVSALDVSFVSSSMCVSFGIIINVRKLVKAQGVAFKGGDVEFNEGLKDNATAGRVSLG